LPYEIGCIGRGQSELFTQHLATDEYLSTLTWPRDLDIYNKMNRADAQIKATLLMLELPIRSTRWYVKPKDSSEKAKEIANFINDCIFTGPPEGLNTAFEEFLKNVCTMFTYGHAVFEKVFKVGEDGYLKWHKFAIRPQPTIYDWLYDTTGELTAVQQYNISQNWKVVTIPKEKLLVFTHDKQQGDVKGISVLRSAYKHWAIKDFLYKISNIGIERNFVGTPVIKLPANYTNADYQLAKEIVTNVRTGEYAGITLPDGFELELFESKRTMMDVIPYINYQDIQISRNILAQFMNLGGNQTTGSYSLSESLSDLYLMMLNASAKYIANTFNSQAIPELVKANFASDLYPKLCYQRLGDERLIDAVRLLVDGKVVVPDEDLEVWVRETLELPDKNPNNVYAYTDVELEEINTAKAAMQAEREDANLEKDRELQKFEASARVSASTPAPNSKNDKVVDAKKKAQESKTNKVSGEKKEDSKQRNTTAPTRDEKIEPRSVERKKRDVEKR
jgi:phage gp29-like protein